MQNNNGYFNYLEHPLKGVNLIEASAGTGKTYNITGLYLRLLLETERTIREILVVTFSEAATEELKDRIRKAISSLLNDLNELVKGAGAEGQEVEDIDNRFNRDFIRKIGKERWSKAAVKLKEALINFDEANIFTIHSFCRRMLNENAFESGILFDVELIKDQSEIKREIIEDFWRMEVTQCPPYFLKHLNSKQVKISIKSLSRLIEKDIELTITRLIPDSKVDFSVIEKDFSPAFSAVKDIWNNYKDNICCVLKDTNIFKQAYLKKVTDAIDSFEKFINDNGDEPALCEELELLTYSGMENDLLAGAALPEDKFGFFEKCDKLLQVQNSFSDNAKALKARLIRFADEELLKRKNKKNVQSFNDLLTNLRSALRSDNRDKLIHNIRTKYTAALIDEFQDTDPIQFEIFDTIFSHEDNILFLIGDPKQAIYGFRGADIFAYLKAANSESYVKCTLGTNFRSQPELIEAVNIIFSKDKSFVFEDIRYLKVNAPDDGDRKTEPLMIGGSPYTPFHIWNINEKALKDHPQFSKMDKEEASAVLTAAEIKRLLLLGQNGSAKIGDKLLKEKDIAVLVKKNKQAPIVQNALNELGITSVIYNSGNVFESQEAAEIERLLSCIAEPHDSKSVKAALATHIIGCSYEDIDRLAEDDNKYDMWLEKFRKYNRIWHSSGFIRMFKQFLNDDLESEGEKIMPRLMMYEDGDRRNTNILHLMELLHKAETEEKLSPQGLIKWMRESRDAEQEKEEHQLRLESDDEAVKIITIHKSKGLEYPVVFLPFMWTSAGDQDNFIFHDRTNGDVPIFELGSDQFSENKVHYQKEKLAEEIRLFYVAVTRAKNCCYLVRRERYSTELMKYLFGKEDITRLESELKDIVNICDMPINTDKEKLPRKSSDVSLLKPYIFYGNVDTKTHIASYTSMLNRYSEVNIPVEMDALSEQEQEEDALTAPAEENQFTRFTFTKGQRAGICLHEILEEADYSNPDKVDFIHKKLSKYRFDTEFTPSICGMIDDTLNTELNDEVVLSSIPKNKRIHEMEFYFPLKTIRCSDLSGIFEKAYGKDERLCNFHKYLVGLREDEIEGFMNGLIDVFFECNGKYYVADWKSNHLGDEIKAYGQDTILHTMEEDLYILQYHLYCVAAHRHLSAVKKDYNYESDFGGVFYLFLRGMDRSAGAEYGVFYHKPPAEVIESLEEYLTGVER